MTSWTWTKYLNETSESGKPKECLIQASPLVCDSKRHVVFEGVHG